MPYKIGMVTVPVRKSMALAFLRPRLRLRLLYLRFLDLDLDLDSYTCWMVDTLGWAATCWAWGTTEGMVAEVVGVDDTSFGFWILRNDYRF